MSDETGEDGQSGTIEETTVPGEDSTETDRVAGAHAADGVEEPATDDSSVRHDPTSPPFDQRVVDDQAPDDVSAADERAAVDIDDADEESAAAREAPAGAGSTADEWDDATGESPTDEESGADGGSAGAGETSAGDEMSDIERWERRLGERELGLEKRSDALDERERRLADRERELDDRERELADKHTALQEMEARLEQRKTELDGRERELEEYEEQLSERAADLNEDEKRLHNYIDGQVEDFETRVHDTIRSGLDSYEDDRTPGRFDTTGNVLAGVAGLTLLGTGLVYGAWIGFGSADGLFGPAVADIAVTVVLLGVGLGINLATVADRI